MTSAITGVTNATSYYTGVSPLNKNAKDKTDPAEELVKYSQMSIGDKLRYKYLRENNMTEESLKAMSPKERADIERQIAEEIKRGLKAAGHNGAPVGLTLNVTA